MAPTSTTALADPLMLDKIDKLFACGVGDSVDLPQIVVVGDQSSGKSSVLEGLIRKPLPRDSGLCTRFATQIVFRRARVEEIEVSIIPDKDADPQHVDRVKAWGRKVEEELDSEVFVKIMKEVHIEMGLAAPGGDDDNDDGVKRPTFSNDVLRLVISGPEQEHLSVIDVPGIFKSTTEGVTTKADIALVRNMVHGYMNNPRSVILTVIPANVDVATQEILELATEADPEGDRTLGVLTKPDLVDRGAEGRVVDLIEGRARVMQLGWHMIRNPGQKEMTEKDLDRNTLEKEFFRNRAPWSDLDDDKVGVDTLRIRLKDVISSLVKREFPKVKAEIKNRLSVRQKRLDHLGPERRGTMEQMAYLTKMAAQFQRIASLALSANYGADDVFNDDPNLRIAPAVMARMKTFSDDMDKLGHEYVFMSDKEQEATPANPAVTPIEPATFTVREEDDVYVIMSDKEQEATPANPAVTPIKPATFTVREEDDVEELIEILHPQLDLCCPLTEGMEDWLSRVFRGNRGFELGTFNATILATAMKKQSQKWADITKGFLSDIIVMVHRFILGALKVVCNDKEIRTAVISTLAEDLTKCYHNAMENANFLLKVESCDTPITLNHYFNDNLQKSRHSKVVAGMKRKAFTTQGYGEVIKLDTATAPINNMSNEDHVIHDIHDILKSYYKVSRKTFVDSICKQSTSHYLLHCDTSPLALFSPVWVSQLSAAALEEIAGEAPAVRRSRALLTKEIGSLRESMKILAWN